MAITNIFIFMKFKLLVSEKNNFGKWLCIKKEKYKLFQIKNNFENGYHKSISIYTIKLLVSYET